MGWLFGWNTRKELADHLIQGNGVHTLKHCFAGNNLWAVQEVDTTDGKRIRFLALYLIKGRNNSRDGWGYKDMDETAGPYYYNCPLSYLDMVPDPMTTHSTPWRERVRKYWAKANQKLQLGQMIRYGGNEYQVTRVLEGKRGYMVSNQCYDYRLTQAMVKRVEVLA